MVHAYNLFHRKSVSGFYLRRAPLQYYEQGHRPNATEMKYNSQFTREAKMDGRGKTNFVVKSTSLVQVFRKRRIRLPAPKVHVRDLKIAPDLTKREYGLRMRKLTREK